MKEIILILLIIISFQLNGQFSDSPSKKELRKSRPIYIDIALGMNYSIFRDFATSPLFYKGPMVTLSLSRLKKDNLRESSFGSFCSLGMLNTDVEKNSSNSSMSTISFSSNKIIF